MIPETLPTDNFLLTEVCSNLLITLSSKYRNLALKNKLEGVDNDTIIKDYIDKSEFFYQLNKNPDAFKSIETMQNIINKYKDLLTK